MKEVTTRMEIKGIETSTYMEIFWPTKDEQTGKHKTTVTAVLDRDPLQFVNTTNAATMLGYRFYDVRTVNINDDDQVIGRPSNFSPMYYFGKRFEIDKIRKITSLKETVESMEKAGSETAILCTCGAIITNPAIGDLTLEECEQLKTVQETGKSFDLRPIEEN